MKRNAKGFTILELMIAVAMAMVLTVIAVPVVSATISSMNLRMAGSALSNALQYARMRAVNIDQSASVRTQTVGGRVFVYIDQNNNGQMDAAEDKNLMVLPRQMYFDSHAPAISLGGSQTYGLPGFTPRGLPCTPGTGTCTAAPGVNFYVFLRQDRIFGGPAYVAVSISPASRIQVWTWNGSTWN